MKLSCLCVPQRCQLLTSYIQSKMKEVNIKIKRIAKNEYLWESAPHPALTLNQTELLLSLCGVMATTLAEGMGIDEEVNIDMRKEKMPQ